MSVLKKTIAINALTWVREGNYIKVNNIDSNRMVYLVNEQADLFEMLDEGIGMSEVIRAMQVKYKEITVEHIEELVQAFEKYDIIKTTSQFEE